MREHESARLDLLPGVCFHWAFVRPAQETGGGVHIKVIFLAEKKEDVEQFIDNFPGEGVNPEHLVPEFLPFGTPYEDLEPPDMLTHGVDDARVHDVEEIAGLA